MGVRYYTSPLNKSALYLEALPQFGRGAVSFRYHEWSLHELHTLERRVQYSGKDAVDHPRQGSDDCANALCRALYKALTREASAKQAASPTQAMRWVRQALPSSLSVLLLLRWF